jgi:hypothetical protein
MTSKKSVAAALAACAAALAACSKSTEPPRPAGVTPAGAFAEALVPPAHAAPPEQRAPAPTPPVGDAAPSAAEVAAFERPVRK